MMAAAPRPPLLVATDFSPSANLAVDRAALLAAQHDWPLHLAHAIAPGFLDELQRLLTPQVPAISSSLVGKAMAELQTLANDPRHTHGLDTDCHVLLGKPVDALLQHASDLCSPLLVVGSRGETSLRHLTVGSTAARLLRKSRQPLLVVKGAATTPYQHALVGIDFSPSSLAALRLVRQLAPQAWLTLLHVLRSFQARHRVDDVVVVADAGMLSAANLNQLEDAGFSFIVGSRVSKAPYDLAEHFDAHGGVLHDGETMESKRVMGVRENARQRRVVYHYSAKRDRRDNHTLDKQVEKAQKIADGKKPLRKDRFVKLTGTRPAVDQVLVDRARQLAGLKGYVTNIPALRLPGREVVAAYHDLFQVERSFRMAKTDLRARPMFHHEADSIHAHLTVVFCALAISRHLYKTTGVTVRRIVRALRPLRDVTITIDGHELTATTPPTGEAADIIAALRPGVGH